MIAGKSSRDEKKMEDGGGCIDKRRLAVYIAVLNHQDGTEMR